MSAIGASDRSTARASISSAMRTVLWKYTEEYIRPRATLRRSADQVGDRGGADPVRFEHLVDPLDVREGAPILRGHVVVVARDDPLGQVHVVHRELAAQDMLQGVGERTVADIVEEA